MTRIAVIGAGTLGARHLQALARLEAPLIVDLVDPSIDAQQKALSICSHAGGVRGPVNCVSEVTSLSAVPDIAIVATNSRDRLAILRELISSGCRKLILEKVLFTRREEYEIASQMILSGGAKVWVNCARRTAPRFHRLQELTAGRAISYRVEGPDWGLACNAIHHLDEWMFLSRAQQFILTGCFEPELPPARRNGYFEVLGAMSGEAGPHTFEALSVRGQTTRPAGDRTITIRCENTEFVIGQVSQDLVVRQDGQIVAREPYPFAMQSEATAWHVAAILAGGEPSLPRYEESAKLHLALLDVLMPHFQSLDPSLTECPIT